MRTRRTLFEKTSTLRDVCLVGLAASLSVGLFSGILHCSKAENIYDVVMRSQNKNANSSSSKSTTGGAINKPPATSYPASGQAQTQSPATQPQSNYSAYPANGQAQYQPPVQAQPANTYPAASQSQYPAAEPAQPATSYPASGPGNAYPANAAGSGVVGQASSKMQNAVNKGIQGGLQRGLNHGANAIDRIGRKFGIQGLGSSLNSQSGLPIPTGTSFPGAQSPSPMGGSPPSGMEESSYKKHFSRAPQYSGGAKDDGRAAWEAAGNRARESQNSAYLKSAQDAEARGDWMQAAFAYGQATGDTIRPEDDEAGRRNHTGSNDEMIKRQSRDPVYKTMSMKQAYCLTQLLNQQYSGQVKNIDASHTAHQLQHTYAELKLRDPGNAAWHYLDAVFYCSDNRTKDWHYIFAWNRIVDALKCPRLTPSIRAKCLALQAHIKPAKELQQSDMRRAVFSMEQDLVWNVEHPHIAGTETRESRVRIDDTHERVTTYYRDYMNTELWAVETYDDCKKDIAKNFPAFKTKWLKQLNDMMTMPNGGTQVPPGPPNEEPAMYCPKLWEDLAFGPLDLTIGRQYPNGTAGTGHYDPDLLPQSYIRAMNHKVKGK